MNILSTFKKALGLSLVAGMSFSAQAKYANHTNTLEQFRAAGTQAITICYYRPKVYMGPSQRGFTVELEGHTSCAQEYNFGILYYIKHTYK